MFGTLGGPELFLIFVVALIVFGPRKLPEIGKSLGKMMGEFRRASNEFRSTIENEVEAEKIRDLADFYRKLWAAGAPGVEVGLTILQGADLRDLRVRSIDRLDFLRRKPTI